MSEITLADAARRSGVTPATLRRWANDGLIPQYDGEWTLAAAAHARIVARLRDRGHSLDEIRRASEGGVLAFAYVEDLFPPVEPAYTIEEAAEESGLEPALIERLWAAVGFSSQSLERLTEEEGEEEALGAVERFVDSVENTLPDEARVIKTIGDEVMIVGSDPAALTDWAVGFQTLVDERPLPRVGIHYGETLYRDGDYYGREVNLAARVAARAAGGEVLVTRPVVESAGGHLEFEAIGEVRLKGFRQPTELFLAAAAE